jgi:hypothetical protein
MTSRSCDLLLCSRPSRARAALVVCLACLVSALCPLACYAAPIITSVSPISTLQSQTITISGSGFGTQAAYTGDSSFIELFDVTKGWAAGYVGPCYNGTSYYGGSCDDSVTLTVESWTNSSIVLGGFSGAWGSSDWTLGSGDEIQIDVWNAQSGAGPAPITTSVAGPAPEPGSLALVGGALGLMGTLRFRRHQRRQRATIS